MIGYPAKKAKNAIKISPYHALKKRIGYPAKKAKNAIKVFMIIL